MRAFVLSLTALSLSPCDMRCRVHELQGHSSVVFRCFADPTDNPCLTLAHKITTMRPCHDLFRSIPLRQMRQQKTHRASSVRVYKSVYLTNVGISLALLQPRCSLHRGAFRCTPPQRFVSLCLDADASAQLRKGPSPPLLMFTDVWSVRGIPKSRPSEGVACRRSSFFASHRIIQCGSRQVQCQAKVKIVSTW